MNPATITTLRDIKQAILDRDIAALGVLSGRLEDLRGQREALVEGVMHPDLPSGIHAAIAAERHRHLMRKRIAGIDTMIAGLDAEYSEAEAAVTQTFAETRALGRLK